MKKFFFLFLLLFGVTIFNCYPKEYKVTCSYNGARSYGGHNRDITLKDYTFEDPIGKGGTINSLTANIRYKMSGSYSWAWAAISIYLNKDTRGYTYDHLSEARDRNYKARETKKIFHEHRICIGYYTTETWKCNMVEGLESYNFGGKNKISWGAWWNSVYVDTIEIIINATPAPVEEEIADIGGITSDLKEMDTESKNFGEVITIDDALGASRKGKYLSSEKYTKIYSWTDSSDSVSEIYGFELILSSNIVTDNVQFYLNGKADTYKIYPESAWFFNKNDLSKYKLTGDNTLYAKAKSGKIKIDSFGINFKFAPTELTLEDAITDNDLANIYSLSLFGFQGVDHARVAVYGLIYGENKAKEVNDFNNTKSKLSLSDLANYEALLDSNKVPKYINLIKDDIIGSFMFTFIIDKLADTDITIPVGKYYGLAFQIEYMNTNLGETEYTASSDPNDLFYVTVPEIKSDLKKERPDYKVPQKSKKRPFFSIGFH